MVSLERIGGWLVIAPIGAAISASLVFAIANWTFGFGAPSHLAWRFDPSPVPLLGLTAFLSVVGSICAIVANFTFGVVWQWIAHVMRLQSPFFHVVAGVASAFVFATLILWQPLAWAIEGGLVTTIPSFAPTYFWAVLIGALTAYFSWLIRRPDRDPPNPATRAP